MHTRLTPVRTGRRGLLSALVVAFVAVVPTPAGPVTAGTVSAAAAAAAPVDTGFGRALVGAAPVGRGPSELAVNPVTHTLYVTNGNNDNGPNAGGDTVSVIDTRRCRAGDVTGCVGPWPTIRVGSRTPEDLPSGVAVDVTTNTVYVANAGAGTVSVIDGATCNATTTSGCAQTPAEVPVGAGPLVLVADRRSRTVYVANSGSTTVSMLDIAACNATRLSGCPTSSVPTVDVGAQPANIDTDDLSHTAYITTFGDRNGWAVLDTLTCNARTTGGCTNVGRIDGDPAGPNDGEVDQVHQTLWTADYGNTISAFDLRHCQAGDLTGCTTARVGVVTPFPQPGFEHDLWVAVDRAHHTVFVSFQKDDTVVAVDSNICNGSRPDGCASIAPRTIHTGADPEGVELDSSTGTLYVAATVGNEVSVVDVTRCNATESAGCRHPAPAVRLPAPGPSQVAPDVHTLYVGSGSALSLIDTDSCRAARTSGCAGSRTVPITGAVTGMALDRLRHTLFLALAGSGGTGSVLVLDTGTCNVAHPTGCVEHRRMAVPAGTPGDLALDQVSGTLYVGTDTAAGQDALTVLDALTCNATTGSGCTRAPATLQVGPAVGGVSSVNVAIDPSTRTLYATDLIQTGAAEFTGSSVYVYNIATCDRSVRSGCTQAPAIVTDPASTGNDSTPVGLTVDEPTRTVYVANLNTGEGPGTLSLIDGTRCNAGVRTGCPDTPTTVPTAFGSSDVALDPVGGQVLVTNDEDTSLSVIDGATCNRADISGCGQPPHQIAVGHYPSAIAVDSGHRTAYVSNRDGTVSVVALSLASR